jgi:hypothetical protein
MVLVQLQMRKGKVRDDSIWRKKNSGGAHRNGGCGGGSVKSGEDSRGPMLDNVQMGTVEDQGIVGCI